MVFLTLYLLFFKIALFTFGGGYAMVALYQQELVTNHGFLTGQEFANIVALAQMTPGPIGLNAATYVGYQVGLAHSGLPAPWGGVLGSAVASLAIVSPSLVVATLVAMFLRRFAKSRLLGAALSGIRPAVLGLIAAAVVFFADASVFAAPLRSLWTGSAASFGVSLPALAIFALALVVRLRWKRLGILWILLGAAVLGILWKTG